MKKLIIIAALAANALAAGADTKTVVFTTQPQMHCESCENRIKSGMRFVKGVKKIETNVERQSVTIKYDDAKTSPEKIKQGFKKIGYEASLVVKSADAVKAKETKK